VTVDPPALAVRLLDIRLALRDEYVAGAYTRPLFVST
jgi:hypothetical protein